MPKYIIRCNDGFSTSYDIEEANDYEEALDFAYEAWLDAMLMHADFSAKEYTEEEAKRLGLEDN